MWLWTNPTHMRMRILASFSEAAAHLERDSAVLRAVCAVYGPGEGALLQLYVVLAHGVLGAQNIHIHLQGETGWLDDLDFHV